MDPSVNALLESESTRMELVILALKIGAGLMVALAGWWLARRLRAGTARAAVHTPFPPSVKHLMARSVHFAMLALAVLAALSVAGVPTATLVAVVAVAGAVAGLAFKESIANFAGTVLVLLFQPYRVGDQVEINGIHGTVREIQVFHTVLVTPDNRLVSVPNAQTQDGNVENLTALGVRRLDLTVLIGADDDLAHAKAVVLATLRDHPDVLESPEPAVGVWSLADNGVLLAVRPWVDAFERIDMRMAIYEAVKLRLDEAGISLPFPQRDVHLHLPAAERDAAA